MRQRKRSEMPNEDEVLAFQLYSAAHGMKLHPGLFNIVWCSEEANTDGEYIEREFAIEKVEDNSAEMHPSITLYVKETWNNARGGKGRNSAGAGRGQGRNTSPGEAADGATEEHGEEDTAGA